MEETENSVQECSDRNNSNNEISHFQDYLYNGTFSNQSKKSTSAQGAGILRSRMDASSTSRFDANILQKEIRIINGGSNSDQFDDESSEIENRNQGFQVQASSNESKGTDMQQQQQYNNYVSMEDEMLLPEHSSNENEERRQTSNFATMQNDFCDEGYFDPLKSQETKMDKSQLGQLMGKQKAFKTIERHEYQISSNASQTDQAVMKKLYEKCKKLTEINQILEDKTAKLYKTNEKMTQSCSKAQEENATLRQRLHRMTVELNSVKDQLLSKNYPKSDQQYSASTICQRCSNDKLSLNLDKSASKYRNEQLYKMVLILEQEKSELQDKNLALLQRQISQRCENLNQQGQSRVRSRAAADQYQFDSIEERYNKSSPFRERKRAMTSDGVIRVDLDQLTKEVTAQDNMKNDRKRTISNSSIDVSARKNKPPLEFKYNELCDKFTSVLQENQQLRKIKQTTSNSSYGRNHNDSPSGRSWRDSSSAAATATAHHSIHVNQMFQNNNNNNSNQDSNTPLNKRDFTYINHRYFGDNQDPLCLSHQLNGANKDKNTLDQFMQGESNLCSGIRREDYSFLPQKYMNLVAKKKKSKSNKDDNHQKKKETNHQNNHHAAQMKENTYQNKDNFRECLACSKEQKDISREKTNSNTRQSSANNTKTISASMKQQQSVVNAGKYPCKSKKQTISKEQKQVSKCTIQEKEENKLSKQTSVMQSIPTSIKARKTPLFSHLRV